MSNSVTLNGISYLIPDTGEGGWGDAVTSYLVALSTGVLQKAGGTFTLTANVDFGASFGLRTLYYTTRTANLASAGQFRMARADVINWRNQADSNNLSLAVNSSDQLTFDGNPISSLALGAANTVLKVNAGGTDTEYGLLTNANIAASGTADIALNKLVATTASRAVETDGSGYLIASATTAAEIALLSGVTALIDDPLTTRGDIIIRNATVPARLPVGAANEIFWSDGTDPSWESQDTKVRTTQAIGNLSSTGRLTGGALSVNGGDPTKFDMSAGSGIVVDNYTDPDNPTYNKVTWTAFTAVTVIHIALGQRSDIGIDSTGAIVQQSASFTTSQRRDYIQIGRIIHLDMANIQGTTNVHHNAFDPYFVASDLADSIGVLNRSGNIMSANGANLKINKSSGETYREGSNPTDDQNPNVTTNVPLTIADMRMVYQDGSGGFTIGAGITDIDPNNWDDGSGSLAVVSNNKWTIQRMFYFVEGTPPQAQVLVHYGQTEYNSLVGAEAAIFSESVETSPIFVDGTFRAWLIVKKGETSLQSSDTVFFAAGKFGGSTGGASSSTTDLQTAYNNSTDPEIVVDGTRGALTIQDASSPIGAPLISVEANGGGTTYLAVAVAGITGTMFLDEDDMASDSAVKLASQQSIKAYVDSLRTGAYDAIVDAAGNADYTSIATAINTEAIGAKIFILDGAYSETVLMTVKETQQIIGQSRDGVVVTFNSGTGANTFEFTALTNNRMTVRDLDNGGWSTVGIGLCTTTQGTVTVGYAGSGDPTATDAICFGGNDYYIIASVNSGSNEFDLNEPFRQQSGTYDVTCFDAPVSLETPTIIKNMTLHVTSLNTDLFYLSDAYHVQISNLKVKPDINGGTVFYTPNTKRIYVDNIEYLRADNWVAGPFIEVRNAMDDCHWSNCSSILNDCELSGDTANESAIKHCTFHFKRAVGQYTNPMFTVPSFLVDCRIEIEQLVGGTAFSENTQSTYADWYGCHFIFGSADFSNASVSSDFNAAACIFEMGNWTGSVDILDAAGIAETNLVTNGRISGTFVSDGNNILSSSCVVGTLSGSVAAREVKGQAFSATNTLTDATTIATDCNLGNVHEVTLTANRTLGAPTNLKDGATYIWKIIQDGGGTNTLAYNAVFKFPGGTAPTLSTGGGDVDILSGWSDGTNIYASLGEDFS